MGFLTTLMASLENPRFTLNSPEAWDYLGGAPASSGMRVTANTALTYSPWWRGINLISDDVAKTPLIAYRRVNEAGREGKERDKEHPAYWLLRRKSNPFMNARTFKKLLTAHALSHGNGYAYIFRRGDGTPDELTPLHPEQTYPVKENGRIWYVTHLEGGEPRKLPHEDVLHIMGLSDDGMIGYSVIEKAKESLGLGLASRKWQSISYKNAGRPAVVLEHPGKLEAKQADELRNTWERMHSGLDNAHRTAVLSGGMKANIIGLNAEDAQLIEGRTFELIDIANFLGLPPHKLGHPARTAFASLEQENQKYLDESLASWLSIWEAECWDKLLTEKEKEEDTHTIEFIREDVVAIDLKTKTEYLRTGLAGRGWLTQNDARRLMNMNPLDSEEADEVLDPLNMVQDEGGDEEPPREPQRGAEPEEETEATVPAPNPQLAAALRDNLEIAARRMVKRIGTHARRAAKEPKKFVTWLDTLEAEHEPAIAETFAAPLAAVAALTGQEIHAGTQAGRLVNVVTAWLLKAAECRPVELEAKVDQAMTDLEATWPGAWAREHLPE